MTIKNKISNWFSLRRVKAVAKTGSDVRQEVKDLHHDVRGDDYYVRYDAIDTTNSHDRLAAEVAFVGSMR